MSTCYFWNGTAAPSDDSTVCNPNAGATGSMCCSTKHGDTCTPEGLCYNIKFNAGLQYWRGTCTDPTWKAPGCVQQCPWYPNDVPPMTRCSDGTWCCDSIEGNGLYGVNNTCCLNSQGVKLQASSALTGSATSTLAAGVSSSTDSSASHVNNTTARDIGLGVGLGIGIPLLLVVVIIAVLKKRARSRSKTHHKEEHDEYYLKAELAADDAQLKHIVEAPDNSTYVVHELDGKKPQPYELEASNARD